MSLRSTLKSIAEYFSLRAAPADDISDFNYAVTAAKPQGFLPSAKAYFDLASDYRAGDKLAASIMDLANAEGVAKGKFISSGMTSTSGYRYSENDTFSVKLEGNGRVLLKCDTDFAEKVGKLDGVGAVSVLKAPAAPAPQTQPEAPKP